MTLVALREHAVDAVADPVGVLAGDRALGSTDLEGEVAAALLVDLLVRLLLAVARHRDVLRDRPGVGAVRVVAGVEEPEDAVSRDREVDGQGLDHPEVAVGTDGEVGGVVADRRGLTGGLTAAGEADRADQDDHRQDGQSEDTDDQFLHGATLAASTETRRRSAHPTRQLAGTTSRPCSRATSANLRSNVAKRAPWNVATSKTQQSGSFRPVSTRRRASRSG